MGAFLANTAWDHCSMGLTQWYFSIFLANASYATVFYCRRVHVGFSDSDDCPSDSEYDSDDWGKYI